MSRRRDGLRIFPVDPAKLGEHYDVPEPTPEFQFERLYEAIEQLPPQERDVIEQLWLEVYDEDRFGPAPRPGAPVAVVAERMNIARSVVRQIERAAFKHLESLHRNLVEQEEGITVRRFIVHITGSSPHAIDKTIGPYVTEAVARATANAHYPAQGDWMADIYCLDYDRQRLDYVGAA